MKKIGSLLFILAALSAFGQITDLKLGSDVWPPFTNADGETAFATEIVKEALNRSRVALDERTLPFDKVIKGIELGALDGSGALWLSEDRQKLLLFSEPYLRNKLVLVTLKAKDHPVHSLDSVRGKSLALVENYSYGLSAEDLHDVRVVKGSSDQVNFLKLLKNEVDYILVDQLLIHHLIKNQPSKVNEHLVISEEPLLVKSLHLAIRKDIEGAEELLEKFNMSTKDMLADGTYNRILKINWIQADVDGDGTIEWVSHQGGTQHPNPDSSYSIDATTSQYATASGNTYYINGKVYTDWNDVPADFKRGPGGEEDVETFNFLRFNF